MLIYNCGLTLLSNSGQDPGEPMNPKLLDVLRYIQGFSGYDTGGIRNFKINVSLIYSKLLSTINFVR